MTQRTGDDDVTALLGQFRAVASPLRALPARAARQVPGRCATARSPTTSPSWPRPTRTGSASASSPPTASVFEVGDAEQPFTIQSISKPFVYGLALERRTGARRRSRTIGVEPTRRRLQLDRRSTRAPNRPHNPMVNAGAIATAGLVAGDGPAERLEPRARHASRATSAAPVDVDMAVFTSERATGHRNRAIAHLMRNFGMHRRRIEESARPLLPAVLDPGHLPRPGDDGGDAGQRRRQPGHRRARRRAPEYVRDVLSVMYTCGMYDYAGEWAYRVGLPAKSGVGGGIIAVVPGQARHRRLLAAARRARQQRARHPRLRGAVASASACTSSTAAPPPGGLADGDAAARRRAGPSTMTG